MKTVGIVVIVIVLLIAGVAAYVFFSSGDLVKRGMEELGPRYLETDVEVRSVDISFTEGSGEIRGFQIGNPAGFAGPFSMRIERAGVVLDPASIGGDAIILKQVVIDGPQLNTVLRGVRDINFQALLDTVERNVGGGQAEAPDGEPIKIIIDRFDFTNAKTSVTSELLADDVQLDLPDIHLTGIGRKTNGVTAAEALRQILEPITRTVVREVVAQQTGIEDVEENLKERVREKLGGGLKDLLGKPES